VRIFSFQSCAGRYQVFSSHTAHERKAQDLLCNNKVNQISYTRSDVIGVYTPEIVVDFYIHAPGR
jgi:hypothetical protein